MHWIWLDCIYIHFSDSLYLVQSSPKEDLTLGSRLQQDLKNDLIAGLLVVIPLATTIWLSTIVSRFVLAILTSIPKQLNPFITLNPLLASDSESYQYLAESIRMHPDQELLKQMMLDSGFSNCKFYNLVNGVVAI